MTARIIAWVGAHIRREPLLATICVLGFALRAASITWGLPLSDYENFYHPDEQKAWSTTLHFPEHYLNNQDYFYGTALQNGLGLALWPCKLYLVGLLEWSWPYTLFVIFAFRLCNVFLGTASIWLAGSLGYRLFGRTTGLVAAAFVCVAFYPCLNSSFATLDVPMSFLTLLALSQWLRAWEAPSHRAFLRLGVVAGLLLGTKISGGLLLAVSFVWFAVQMFRPFRALTFQVSVLHRLTFLFVYVVTAVCVFAVSTPQVFLNPGEYVEFIQRQKLLWYDAAPQGFWAIVLNWFTATAKTVGLPITLLSMLGVSCLSREQREIKLGMLGLILSQYLLWQGFMLPRFAIVTAPLLCILAAQVCAGCIASRSRPIRVLSRAGVGVMLAVSTCYCLLGIVQRHTDPRPRAAAYITHRIPRKSTIGVASTHNFGWGDWRNGRVFLGRHQVASFLDRPQYIVVSARELQTMAGALGSEKLRPGYHWDSAYNQEWYLHAPPSPEIFRFFEELLRGSEYRQIARFDPAVQVPVEFASPTFFIFRKNVQKVSSKPSESDYSSTRNPR